MPFIGETKLASIDQHTQFMSLDNPQFKDSLLNSSRIISINAISIYKIVNNNLAGKIHNYIIKLIKFIDTRIVLKLNYFDEILKLCISIRSKLEDYIILIKETVLSFINLPQFFISNLHFDKIYHNMKYYILYREWIDIIDKQLRLPYICHLIKEYIEKITPLVGITKKFHNKDHISKKFTQELKTCMDGVYSIRNMFSACANFAIISSIRYKDIKNMLSHQCDDKECNRNILSYRSIVSDINYIQNDLNGNSDYIFTRRRYSKLNLKFEDDWHIYINLIIDQCKLLFLIKSSNESIKKLENNNNNNYDRHKKCKNNEKVFCLVLRQIIEKSIDNFFLSLDTHKLLNYTNDYEKKNINLSKKIIMYDNFVNNMLS